MVVAGIVVAVLAGLLHVYIFVMESLTWTSAATRRVFGTSAEEAAATQEMAYNQGFYNLFLAVQVFVGAGLWVGGHESAAVALLLAGAGSMAAAALVLALRSPGRVATAAKQGTLPIVAVVLVVLGLLL